MAAWQGRQGVLSQRRRLRCGRPATMRRGRQARRRPGCPCRPAATAEAATSAAPALQRRRCPATCKRRCWTRRQPPRLQRMTVRRVPMRQAARAPERKPPRRPPHPCGTHSRRSPAGPAVATAAGAPAARLLMGRAHRRRSLAAPPATAAVRASAAPRRALHHRSRGRCHTMHLRRLSPAPPPALAPQRKRRGRRPHARRHPRLQRSRPTPRTSTHSWAARLQLLPLQPAGATPSRCRGYAGDG